MIVSAWWFLASAIPVLMLGELLVRKIKFLSRFNIPAPVVGGLLISLAVLLVKLSGAFDFGLATKVDAKWWTWLVTTEIEWAKTPKVEVHRPFLVAFFTCIGLNASWSLVKRGGIQVLIFLIIAAVLALFQNIISVALAKILGVPLLLGVVCGSTTMTGGHATALGFAGELEKAGLPGAGVLGAAAATFGLIAGGLIGGPLGGALIRKKKLQSTAPREVHLESGQSSEPGILNDLRALASYGKQALPIILLLLVCIKIGSWISYFIQQTHVPLPMIKASFSPAFNFDFDLSFEKQKLTFPIYMGAMLLGVTIRNVVDAVGGRWIKTEIVDTMSSVMLGIFLAIAMMSLNFIELASAAGPMLVILAVQVGVMALFAWFVTFRIMGRDFEAAVMSGGHCGFGLGATPNAVANMKSLVETFGPAPRAFLVVPIVGAFLMDFLNAINITFFINLVK
ncbi:MAG: sodium/glutamate symporter [Verrucomicrobiota bacterium]